MILFEYTEARFSRIEKEYADRDRLAHHGLRYRQKILIYGAPGCGKTMGAERIAWNVGLPLIKLQPELMLLSPNQGETIAAIRKVFEFAEANPCLLLIDGFDWSMGTFLQLLGEYHPTNGLLVATANLPKSTREEISWRFDDAIQMLKPGSSKIESLLKRSLSSMDVGDIDWEAISWQMPNASFAQVVRVAQNAAKAVVIGRRERVERGDLEEAIRGLESN